MNLLDSVAVPLLAYQVPLLHGIVGMAVLWDRMWWKIILALSRKTISRLFSFLDPRNNIYLFSLHSFREVSLEQSGEYECRASNVAGTSSVTASLIILQSPEITIKPGIELLSVTEGDEIIINCQAIGKPIPNVEWHRSSHFAEYVQILL